MKNRELMSSGNPFKTVIVFSVPSILAMLVNAVYNIVDKIFIGTFVSFEALEGLQVVNPLLFLSFAVVVMFGLGSASYASNKLGAKKDDEANKIFNNSLIFQVLCIVVVSLIYLIFNDALLKMCGVLDQNYAYAKEYFITLIFGLPLQAIAYFFTMNMRTEGRPVYSMFAQVTGCVVNIIFDALFIIVFKWGVFGAAFATVLGHLSNACIGLYYYLFSKKNYFKINLKEAFKINWHYIVQVMTIGFSSAVLNICNFVSAVIYNNVVGKYANGLGILSILNSLDSICIMPCVGIRQGLIPLFGYCYGEKKYDRVFKLYKAGMIYGIGYGLIICTCMMLFPSFFVSFFTAQASTEAILSASKILTFYQLGIITISFNMNTGAIYQATRQRVKATILSAMRQCLYLIPALLILDAIAFSTSNSLIVWLATPISDILSSISSVVLYIITFTFYKRTGYLCKNDQKRALLDS